MQDSNHHVRLHATALTVAGQTRQERNEIPHGHPEEYKTSRTKAVVL